MNEWMNERPTHTHAHNERVFKACVSNSISGYIFSIFFFIHNHHQWCKDLTQRRSRESTKKKKFDRPPHRLMMAIFKKKKILLLSPFFVPKTRTKQQQNTNNTKSKYTKDSFPKRISTFIILFDWKFTDHMTHNTHTHTDLVDRDLAWKMRKKISRKKIDSQ